jgi:hypothetical protein
MTRRWGWVVGGVAACAAMAMTALSAGAADRVVLGEYFTNDG